MFPCAGFVGGVFPEPPEPLVCDEPPPPDPPGSPGLAGVPVGPPSDPPPPPPVDVIELKLDEEPALP